MQVYRIVIGQISHETNTFSPIATELKQFTERGLSYGEQMFTDFRGTKSAIAGFMDAAEDANKTTGIVLKLIPTVSGSAVPSGTVTAPTFEHLVGELISGIEKAKATGGVDGVLLALHGAMVSENYPDAEGEILARTREAVGSSVPVCVTLDLHGNITEKMVANADAFFGYDTNPHIDGYERAIEATHCMVDILLGRRKPTMAIEKLQMQPPTINMRTAEGPMVHLFGLAREWEQKPGVINVSVFGGFPFADIADAGSCIIAVTDNDPGLAQKIARELGREMWNIRHQFLKKITPVREAVARAMDPEAQAAGKPGPIILADVADNPGGGGSGDTTMLLETLLNMGAKDVGFAIMWDPEAVARAVTAGVGGVIDIELGGKVEPAHGKPVPVAAKVLRLTDGVFHNTGPMGTGLKVTVGPTALLEVGGVQIIVISQRTAPNDPEIFRHVGIDPEKKAVLVVKSRGHFRAGYEPFAKEIIEVDCPGAASPNLAWFRYVNIRRPIFPLDEI